ncbi:MAG TPA: hypothetical protein VE981_10525 [Planctomycetota bacterium]|nr:hypothetical protein [Planctomycetota bacterium]
MGVHGTFCQLCGLPAQHDHYVPTRSGMLKIYRGSGAGGGHRWEADERPFPFGPEHEWLKDAVVLPWDEEMVLRGPIEDGSIETGDGDSLLVFEGAEDGLAFHHFCWEVQGSPGSTGPAVSAAEVHLWSLVDAYQEQLFEFQELKADGKEWMLSDPAADARSRARIEAMLQAGRKEFAQRPTTLEQILETDRDWSTVAVRDKDHARRSLVRARRVTLEEVPKTGYGTLIRISRDYQGSPLPDAAEMSAAEAFEIELKGAVERDARAVLAVVGIGKGRVEHLVYARDAAATRAAVGSLPDAKAATLSVSEDPLWAESTKLIRSLR